MSRGIRKVMKSPALTRPRTPMNRKSPRRLRAEMGLRPKRAPVIEAIGALSLAPHGVTA